MWKNWKCDVTWSLPPPLPLSQSVTLSQTPSPPLKRDILYGRPPIYFNFKCLYLIFYVNCSSVTYTLTLCLPMNEKNHVNFISAWITYSTISWYSLRNVDYHTGARVNFVLLTYLLIDIWNRKCVFAVEICSRKYVCVVLSRVEKLP